MKSKYTIYENRIKQYSDLIDDYQYLYKLIKKYEIILNKHNGYKTLIGTERLNILHNRIISIMNKLTFKLFDK